MNTHINGTPGEKGSIVYAPEELRVGKEVPSTKS